MSPSSAWFLSDLEGKWFLAIIVAFLAGLATSTLAPHFIRSYSAAAKCWSISVRELGHELCQAFTKILYPAILSTSSHIHEAVHKFLAPQQQPVTIHPPQENEVNNDTEVTPPKPFDFRPRQWHEPPEGFDMLKDYYMYEVYDAVQKEFKDCFGPKPELEWSTNWLDNEGEYQLLIYYVMWSQRQQNMQVTEKERAFYRGLERELWEDWGDVKDEMKANDERFGKTEKDRLKLQRLMHDVQIRARLLIKNGKKARELAQEEGRAYNGGESRWRRQPI